MIKKGKMTKAGLEKIKEAKASGRWKLAYSSKKGLSIPSDIDLVFKKNISARKAFEKLANSKKLTYLFWIEQAKKKETREKRIREMFGSLRKI